MSLSQYERPEEVHEIYKKEGKELVIYRNKVYDCSKFIKMHPGGKKVIEEHLGKSIDEPFDETGHSKNAKSFFGTRLP